MTGPWNGLFKITVSETHNQGEETMLKISTTILVLLLTFFALLSADAAETLQSQTEQAAAINDTINEINALEIEIEKAKQDQLDVLSPDWFAKAETSLNKAKGGAEKGSALAKIREYITDTGEYLKNAEETAKVARTMLPQVLESRRKAHLAGAVKLVKEYANVEDQFLKLTKAIEKNNIKYTQKNASTVEQAYQDLELLAIKNEAIGKARELVTQAEEDKAEKYAPQALELAQRRLSEADDFVTKDRYATDEIQNKAQAALFSANRVRVLTDQSKKFEMMTPENTSLWVEDVLSKITTWLSAKDARDQDLESQLGNIQQSITTLKDDNKRVSDQLTSMQNKLAETKTSYETQIDSLNQSLAKAENKAVQEQKVKEMLLADQKVKESALIKDKERILAEQKATAQTLEDERRFNQKYIEIQKSFGTDEAEVYKRGNQLIMRLKGMQFPVGTAVIMPENYQLLSKVQRAIKLFKNPSVVIEGHSDSTGSDEINIVLSQQRAEAVMDYLIANNTLTKNKVVAMGYGSSKPVASNSNAEGRAANRRIDVIVTPGLN
jgi:outer membrane protein OmpA-like peptidoglycan-associated protein